MAIETKEKEIGGLRFSVEQLPYFRAQRLFVRLIKLAGPALTGLFTLAGATNGRAALAAVGDLDTATLTPMLSEFFGALHPDEVETITREILASTKVYLRDKFVPLVDFMDLAIGGDFWTGLMVQAFALSVHFGNFSGARAALDGLGLKASRSQESATSTDSKGASASAAAGAA